MSAGSLPEKPRRLARRVVYRSPWVNLYVDRVLFPGGRIIERHHLLDFEKEAVGAVVTDARGNVLLVQAYRYTTDTLEWEIPAGGIDAGETPLQAARREVEEETGYRVGECAYLFSYNPMNGISNKVFHVAHCRVGERIGSPDPNEIRSLRWAAPEEIRSMLRSGLLRDGFSLTALLWYGAYLA